jgi:GGDEF domain-containing protein
VVAGAISEEGASHAFRRLELAAAEQNANPGRHYSIGFSLGHATAQMGESSSASLDDLLNLADSAMYAIKRNRKLEGRG